MLDSQQYTLTLYSNVFFSARLWQGMALTCFFRTDAEAISRRRSRTPTNHARSSARRRSDMPTNYFRTNDADRIVQSRPWCQMKKEGSAGMFGELELNPRMGCVQMDANHSCRPATIAGGERSLIKCGEPAVRDGHLVVGSKRP